MAEDNNNSKGRQKERTTDYLSYSPPFKAEVKRFIKKSGIPIARVAQMIGMSRSLLDYHLSGDKRIKPEIFRDIKNAVDKLNREAEEKMNLKAEDIIPFSGGNVKIIDESFTPILKFLNLINGIPDMSDENIAGYTFFSYRDKEGCFGATIHSDDMKDSTSSRSIEEDDIIIVDPKIKVISGDTVLCWIYGGQRCMVRMVIFKPGDETVILKCLNPKYPDLELQKSEINQMYKVVCKQGKTVWY